MSEDLTPEELAMLKPDELQHYNYFQEIKDLSKGPTIPMFTIIESLARTRLENKAMREGIKRAIEMQLDGASDGCGFAVDYLPDIFKTRDILSIKNTILSSQSLIDNAIKNLTALLKGA